MYVSDRTSPFHPRSRRPLCRRATLSATISRRDGRMSRGVCHKHGNGSEQQCRYPGQFWLKCRIVQKWAIFAYFHGFACNAKPYDWSCVQLGLELPNTLWLIIVDTLQYPAAHCTTMQHTAPHYNTLQHTATHCDTLQHLKWETPD